jgi:large subunit ribosomal protein L30
MAELKITLKRSPIGYEKSQGATARALGLRRRGATVTRPDNPSIRGMVFKICHLVEVTEVTAAGGEDAETGRQ